MTLYWAPRGLDINRWSKNPNEAHRYPGSGDTGVPEGNSGLTEEAEEGGTEEGFLSQSASHTKSTQDDDIPSDTGYTVHIRFDDMTIWR